MNVTQWHGCYSGSWNGILVPDAFAHPAKFAPMLIYRILRHMLERGYIQPGDSLLDPFGGIGSGGYYAMLLGLHWTGVELEPRFVELGQRNIAKWRRDLAMLNGTLGTARLLQGDSRRLLEVVGMGMAGVVSSPPYIDAIDSQKHGLDLSKSPTSHDRTRHKNVSLDGLGANYGSTPGQLGSMPSGDYGAAVSSPPFGDQNDHERPLDSTRNKNGRHTISLPYGDTAGNIGILRADDAGFTAAVSSPPYADAVNGTGEGPGARHDTVHHNGDNAFKASSDSGYGSTPGNVGNMRDGGFEGVVSSPPFESTVNHDGGKADYLEAKNLYSDYGEHPANIGNDTGDTFWTAARAIVEQTYAALRPGGYAAFVTKNFVRKGAIVPFSDQWEQLCAAVGFEPVERIAAMLVADHGDQLDIFGGATARLKERKSFFRRLAEKKGSPRIDHEDVIIMRKPATE